MHLEADQLYIVVSYSPTGQFFDEISSLLEILIMQSDLLIVLVDFNIHPEEPGPTFAVRCSPAHQWPTQVLIGLLILSQPVMINDRVDDRTVIPPMRDALG